MPTTPAQPARRNWPAIRLAYVNQEGSLASLSARFGVPLCTLERRCSREGWRDTVTQCGGVVAAVGAEVAGRGGDQLGLAAAAPVHRPIAVTERLIELVERKLDAGDLPVSQIRQLTAAWRDIVLVGREAFGLDRKETSPRL